MFVFGSRFFTLSVFYFLVVVGFLVPLSARGVVLMHFIFPFARQEFSFRLSFRPTKIICSE